MRLHKSFDFMQKWGQIYEIVDYNSSKKNKKNKKKERKLGGEWRCQLRLKAISRPAVTLSCFTISILLFHCTTAVGNNIQSSSPKKTAFVNEGKNKGEVIHALLTYTQYILHTHTHTHDLTNWSATEPFPSCHQMLLFIHQLKQRLENAIFGLLLVSLFPTM